MSRLFIPRGLNRARLVRADSLRTPDLRPITEAGRRMRSNAATALDHLSPRRTDDHARNRKPPPGDDPMSGAEAAARRTAAAAVLGDFHRAVSDWIDKGGTVPEWASWPHRLATAVESLLGLGDDE
jgi:hypothetical protein